MRLILVILTLCYCHPVTCQDIAPSARVIWPAIPVLVEPDSPPPVQDSSPVSTLKPDEFLVIESTVELIIRIFPEGHIAVEAMAGPVKVRARFADGTGKIETREYRTAFVYFLTSEKAGIVGIDLIPVGAVLEKDIERHVLTVSDGTQPIPPPGPGPVPVDPVIPTPITPTKLQVVIIEDPAQRATIPAEKIIIMDGAEIRDYCKTHCSVTGTTPDRRVLSLRQDVSNQPQWIKDACAEPRTSTPWIVILTPTQKISGPLPATVADTMTLLRKYGGD